LAVDGGIDASPQDAPRATRYVGFGSRASDQIEDGIAVVAAIPNYGSWYRQTREELRHGLHVGSLPGRDQQPNRQAVLVDDGMDFGAQSSTRTANGVIRAPFFPPAACW